MDEVVVYNSNVVKLTTEIKVIQDNVCQGMIEIGKRLIEIKKELGHGQWLSYLENELEYKPTTASNLMRVSKEFSDSNFQSIENINSTKVFALLDIPSENREDFLQNLNIESSTVKQLKEEITKYKHDNDLMTEKQKKAYEDKNRAIEETKRLQAELQREKSKPAKVETKVVEKVVEKVIDKTDYNTINKLKKLEEDNKRLEESKRVFENAMNTYKQKAEKYQDFKDKVSRMACINGGDVDEIKALDDVNNLYISMNKFIKNELSPVKYDNCMRFINNSEHVTQSFVNMINVVEDWCFEMREKLNQNNNIITVEVK